MELSAINQGESVVTDEPNPPIEEPSDRPLGSTADPRIGQADAAPAAADENAPAGPDAEAQPTPQASPQPQVAGPGETAVAEQSGPETGVTPPNEPGPDKPAAERAAAAPASEQASAEAPPEAEEQDKSDQMDWYILKVQSNREDSIREGLLRRVKISGLEPYFGQIIVPTEQVTEFKQGKKRVSTRKLYPGYLVVQMEINEDTWFLVRETPGIGDFTGAAGRPTPMQPHEISRILAKQEEKGEEAPKLRIAFRPGDRVKINEGTFENFEGEVDTVDETNGRVTVMINIFGRSTPVELEYWQIESV
jgi:transcriptional antiterminator NusG